MKNSIKREQSQTGLNSAERENFGPKVKKYIELTEEVLARLVEGKCVEGSLHRDQWTGRITFRAYNRQPRVRRRDKLVCELENGWLKEGTLRYKLYISVRKALGRRLINVLMHRELMTAMNALEVEELLDNV